MVAVVGMVIVFYKHISLKRELTSLKEDMKAYTLENGVDDGLWYMFAQRTRVMLKFKR